MPARMMAGMNDCPEQDAETGEYHIGGVGDLSVRTSPRWITVSAATKALSAVIVPL